MHWGAARLNRSRIGLLLVACALALRLIVAPGFMPVASADGITISMCTGMGAVEVKLPGKHMPTMPQQGECAFAGLGALAIDSLAPVVAPLPIVPAAVRFLAPAKRFPHIGAAAPPPPPTGPPSLT